MGDKSPKDKQRKKSQSDDAKNQAKKVKVARQVGFESVKSAEKKKK